MENADVEPLIDRYESVAPGGLRLALWYDGDEYEIVHVREDVREQYTPEEFEEKVKHIVVEGISDQPNQEQFRMLGELSVAIRKFDHGLMFHFPRTEYTGIAVTFDVDAVPSIDTLVEVAIDELGTPSNPQ